jgi:DNA-binding XRE family transcriptional regulator
MEMNKRYNIVANRQKLTLIDNMLSFKLASTEEIGQELGARLREHRLAQNLQQAELAARAGVSEGTIRNLERKGQTTLDSLLKVVMTLGLIDELAELFVPRSVSIKALEAFGSKRVRASRSAP